MRLRIDNNSTVFESRVGETSAPTIELLSCIADTLRWSLLHSRTDCGAYTALPWIQDLVHCYEAARNSRAWRLQGRDPLKVIPLTRDETIRPTFLLILRLFEACLHHRLLTGCTTATDFEQLLRLLRYPELPPLPADLTLVALASRKSDEPLSVQQMLEGSEVSGCMH